MKIQLLFIKGILIILFFFPQFISAQVFVDINASGLNDGSSWANAYTNLYVALNNTNNGEIWVANGIYKPTTCNPCLDADREISFSISALVQLYGGFAGTETQLNERDWTTNLTILSGDIGIANDSTDNSYKVVVAENALNTTILDGFIVEEGNADGSFGFSSGGGLYIDANPGGTGHIQVRNCTFRNNYAGGGGAIAIDCVLGGESEALIRDCRFEGNTASLQVVSTGAAIFMQGNSGAQIQPRIINCSFIGNFVGNDGGAISMTPTGTGTLLASRIDSCEFINNQATDRGGAIWYRMSSEGESRVVISNNRFESNIAGGQGGAIFARSSFGNVSNDTIINCIFTQNNSDGSSINNDGEGGAVFLRGSQDGTRNHEIINCLFDRNFANDRGGAVGTTSFFSSAGTCHSNFVNCTFYGNQTEGEGGAIHAEGSDGVNNMNFSNSIFWQDSASTTANEFFTNDASITVSFCDVAGGIPTGITDGGNNLDTLPQFADPFNGDLHLTGCSPLIDIGNNNSIPSIVDTDADGDARIHNDIVDLGAYEVGIIYVDLSATGGANNGKSWTDAFLDFQDAIGAASSGDQIWIAQGTYFPTNCLPCLTADREIPFYLKPDVEVYGGFAGTETELEQRDWTTNLTILSGDIGVLNDSTDNSYKILIAENATDKTILDGFIVEEGNADGSFGFSSGGGLYIDANPGGTGHIQVRNCTFRNNYAGGGGAIAIDCVLGGESEALIRDCRFEGNTASLQVVSTGAAIFMQGNSGAQIQPRIINCSFIGNFVGNDGGAISMTPTGTGTLLASRIDSCEFINNQATDRGGAIWYRMSSEGESRVVISNNRFESNIAGGQGGAIFARSSFGNVSNDTIINCIFTQNNSDGSSINNDGEGGAVFLRGSQDGTRNHEIINCLFDRNFANDRGGAVGTTSFFSSAGTCHSNFVNCTFYGNQTEGEGGAIHAEGSDGVNNMNFSNSIFWQDSASTTANEFYTNDASLTVSFCDVAGGIPTGIMDGGDNIDIDPQFLAAANGDFRLSSCSPAIDAGQNSAIPLDLIDLDGDENTSEQIDLDLNGFDRFFNITVDLGAYEWNGTPELMTLAFDSSNVSCNGFCDGIITVTPEGGVPGYEISWSNGANTTAINGLCPGTYSVTVSDAFSCVLIDSVTITENEQLALTVTSDTLLCLGESILLTAAGSGGTGNYTYNWDNGLGTGPSHTVTPTSTTIYSVTVTDENDCTFTESVGITIGEVDPEITGQLSICTGTSTTLDAGVYESYLWSNNEQTQSITVNTGGIYSVTVTDANGCTGTDAVEVLENDNLSPEITGQLSICSGTSTMLDAGVYELYLWSNNEQTQSITVNTGGIYSVTVTDANGCTGTDEVEVLENDNLSPEITGQLSICSGTSTTLDAGEYESYLWSNNEQTQSITVNAGGIYSVTVTDANGCTGTDEVEVLENDNLSPEITGQLSICTGTSTTLDAGVYESYLWSNNEQNQSITVNTGGIYSVTVTDANGCTGTDEVEVLENDNLSPEITGQLSICTGTSTTLDAGEYESYLWSNNEETQSITVNTGGIYSVTVTDANGCTGTDEVEVLENDNLSPEITGQLSICTGTSTTLDAGEYESYLWSNNEETQSITVNTGGIYSVTVTDANGCTGTDEVEVLENDNLSPEITGQLSICTGTSTTLDAGEYESYLWSNNEQNQSITVNTGGIYSVTVTDANGCTGTDEVEVISTDAITTEEEVELCYGGEYAGMTYFENTEIINEAISVNGCDSTHTIHLIVYPEILIQLTVEDDCIFDGATVIASVSGGNGNYHYEWSNGAEDPILSGVPEGNISLTVTDDLGCSSVESILVDTVETLTYDYEVQHIRCFGEQDGAIEINVTGGFPPFTIEWAIGSTADNIENLGPGNYTVFISDGNGCLLVNTIQVFEPAPLLVNVSTTPATNGNNGTATANVSGGTTPYTFQWSTGSNEAAIVNLMPGTYSVTVTDANGCVTESLFQILANTTAIADFDFIKLFSLYPNPNNGQFYVEIQLTSAADFNLQVVNVLNQRVLDFGVYAGDQFVVPVDMQHLQAGSYYLILNIKGRKFFTPFLLIK